MMSEPLPKRMHTFKREPLHLWADRVPAMHGYVNLYTLWRFKDGRYRRLAGGLTMPQLREFIREADKPREPATASTAGEALR